jgi:LL-diaminopimelate aminotransferase
VDVTFSQRLGKLPPYLFADLRRKIAAKRAEGMKVITLGIGDPDVPTPAPIVAELQRAVDDANDPDRHRYGCDVPVTEFPAAVRSFYQRRFGVALAGEQVVTTMGSKDAIAKFPLAVMDPGDVGIAPLPGYPTYNIGHVFAGGSTYYVPLRPENDYLLDVDEIPADLADRAKLLWINYPNNPTTALADLDFFARAVEFGRTHNVLICHDAAYTENTFDGYQAPSILQVDGADDVAVEFFSLSKGFNMTGWRLGCLVGNASAVRALSTIKDNVDNGSLRALQFAAAAALNSAETLTAEANEPYKRRRDMVCEMLNAAGWNITPPQATIYLWVPVPAQYAQRDGEDGYSSSGQFAEDLLETHGVVITPGRGYGETGEGFFRISLTYPDDVLKAAVEKICEMNK